MNRAHGVYRGRRGKYIRPCSPSPIRGAAPGASAQARVTTGPPWATRPRPRVPETARAPPVPLMDLRFPTLGRGGPAPRATQRPARRLPARPPTPNVMSVQAFPSLMGWRPRTPGIYPAHRLGVPVQGPVASPPLDPCPDNTPPWNQHEPSEPLTQRTLVLVRPYWLTGSAAHYAVIRDLCSGYSASMGVVLNELLNLFGTIQDSE